MELQVEQTDIRIDQYLAQELDISRSKIQKLMNILNQLNLTKLHYQNSFK